jgi:hypothetical protein
MSQERTDIVVNGVHLSAEQLAELERSHRAPLRDGRYWYDPISGAWGAQGGPTLGFIHAGLELGGPLPADASNGETGVFVNGRELHWYDLAGLQQLGPIWPGRYWIDALGNFGIEGGARLGNLCWLVQQRLGAPWAVHAVDSRVASDS